MDVLVSKAWTVGRREERCVGLRNEMIVERSEIMAWMNCGCTKHALAAEIVVRAGETFMSHSVNVLSVSQVEEGLNTDLHSSQ
jgi:hypothetical protein